MQDIIYKHRVEIKFMIRYPFLWACVKMIEKDLKTSGGQERPYGTESLSEESKSSLIEIV